MLLRFAGSCLGESRAPFVFAARIPPGFAARAQAEPGCSRRGSAAATVGLAAVGGRACSVPMPAGGDACLGTHACSAYTPASTKPARIEACSRVLPAFRNRSVAGILGAGIHHRAGILRWQAFTRAGMCYRQASIIGRLPRVAGISVWQASYCIGWVGSRISDSIRDH
jgi:hypothetical protein